MSQNSLAAVVTNYNYGSYLPQAINSLLEQTRPLDQIIVVDDGSTDNSTQILDQFQREHSRVMTVLSQPNSGVVEARNNGASKIETDYFFFLDADDYLHPTYAQEVLGTLEKAHEQDPNVALAYTDQQLFGQTDGVVKANPWNVRKLLYRNYLNVAAIFKSEVYRHVGGFSEELNKAHSFDDWDFWLSIAEHGYKGIYIPKPLAYYRTHDKGRNIEAMKQRQAMEAMLHRRHPKLYNNLYNQAYIRAFSVASRFKNKIVAPPGLK